MVPDPDQYDQEARPPLLHHQLPPTAPPPSLGKPMMRSDPHVDAAAEHGMPRDSPRTPSPILGGGRPLYGGHGEAPPASAEATGDGHLTFPQVGMGLGSMEQEMNMLMDLESYENEDEASELGSADVSGVLEQLGKLGYAPPSMPATPLQAPHATDDVNARAAHLARLVWQLGHRLQEQDKARERLVHGLRVTRLASLSLFSSLRISYSHMLQAERDIKARLEVELSGSKIQSKMLSDMVSRASLHTGGADEADVGGSGADSERTKLLADKRFLRQRVKDTEAQVARLERELRDLRPMLLRATMDEDMHDAFSTPRKHTTRTSRRREAVMGDAQAEHLILATRMLRTLRHAARPSTASADGSPTKQDAWPSTPRRMRDTYPSTPKSTSRLEELHSPYGSAARSVPLSAYSTGIDDLLHAAQSLGPHASYAPSQYMTPSRVSWRHRAVRDDSALPLSAPVLGSPKRRRVLMDVDDPPASALDVLAEQAVSEHPTSPSRYASSTYGYVPGSASLPSSARTTPTKSSSTRPFSSQSPEKRLPYVRWSADEDIKLRRAIKEHGQRWEHVARAVGTRSYHQCRQRYLLMRRKEAAASGGTSPNKQGDQAQSQPAPTHPQASSNEKEEPSRDAVQSAQAHDTRDDKSTGSTSLASTNSSDTDAPPSGSKSTAPPVDAQHLFHAQHHPNPNSHVAHALPPPMSMQPREQALHS